MIDCKKIDKCPKKKWFKIKPKGWRCKRCEFYSPKKWFAMGKEIEVFCTYSMNDQDRKFIKGHA